MKIFSDINIVENNTIQASAAVKNTVTKDAGWIPRLHQVGVLQLPVILAPGEPTPLDV